MIIEVDEILSRLTFEETPRQEEFTVKDENPRRIRNQTLHLFAGLSVISTTYNFNHPEFLFRDKLSTGSRA
jgi:hypothetical protein